MRKTYSLKRGYDIKLKGAATLTLHEDPSIRLFALKPTDLHGLTPIPKLVVDEGDEVKAGDPLYFDKPRPDVMYCAPVSGEVVEIRRGPKRAITEVVLLADNEINYREFGPVDVAGLSREAILQRLLESGTWPLIRQRPFHVVPDPTVTPRDVFISCFDTAPLAPDYNFVMQGKAAAFQAGLDVLAKLTDGAVYLGVSPNSGPVFTEAQRVNITTFSGPHPAGNVGVHLHHIRPVNKGEVVWTLKPQDVAIVGKLFTEGIYDAERIVALAGSSVKQTGYYKTRIGASIKKMVEGNVEAGDLRYISGNVLTGTRIAADGFVGFFDDLVTVIPEGNEAEFLGWLVPSYPRPSLSKTFLSYLRPNKKYEVNTNMHGEPRAYVMTGQYEKVTPMALYPQHLIKSIMYKDFDQMEGLGIYEVVEEDLALCEFVCTSKTPVQKILRDGLDTVYAEG